MNPSSKHRIMQDGRCGNCREPMASIEDGMILIRTRLERINPETGEVEYKCRNCRQWLSSPFYKVDLRACLAV
jgi:hypothetical protein